MFKKILTTLMIAGLLCTSHAMAAYPEKPIHIVVPWGAGGGTDLIARALAESMKKYTDVPVIVENITGAGGSTGNKKVADAEGDGYTILFNGDTDILANLTVMQTEYTLDDFKYIGGVFYSPTWILSHKDSGITSITDFIEKAKAEPNKLILASTTPSGAQMIMAALIQMKTGAPFRIIPYQGGKDMTKTLLGNQVQAGIIHAPLMLPEVKAGLINVIGSGGSLEKSSYEKIQDMPTLKEIGIPVEMGINRGILVPNETSDEVVSVLTDIVYKATHDEDFINFGKRFGFMPQWTDGEQFKKDFYDQLPLFLNFENN